MKIFLTHFFVILFSISPVYYLFLNARWNTRFIFIPFGMFLLMGISSVNGQDTNHAAKEKHNIKSRVYRIRPWINTPIIVGGLVGNYFGVKALRHKKGPDLATVLQLTPKDVNAFDRGAAKQNPAVAQSAMRWSDYTMLGTFALSGFLLLDKKIKKDALNVGIVFLTTISIMSNAYSWGVGHMNRYRPYVYNTKEDLSRRLKNGSKNSFYGGHVAAAATASFFIAKVYHDYNPGSRLSPYLFGAAVIPPTIVGYFRYRSGMHFPTDIISGFAAGTIFGILIPQIHKVKKNKNLSFYPGPGGGLAMTYHF